jgi:uncharacterized protein
VHDPTNEQARRIAIRARLPDAPRPTDMLALLERPTFVQIEPATAFDTTSWRS